MITWQYIVISLPNGRVIFNGYFSVNETNVVQNFYYVNNNQYVDILVRVLGGNSSDNVFLDNNFTNAGTNIKSVIPYININFNNPYQLNLWRNGNVNTMSYNPINSDNLNEWPYSSTEFIFTFTSISGLPVLPRPSLFSLQSLFSNNSQVYYKPHSLSTGSGGVGNYRIKRRKT